MTIAFSFTAVTIALCGLACLGLARGAVPIATLSTAAAAAAAPSSQVEPATPAVNLAAAPAATPAINFATKTAYSVNWNARAFPLNAPSGCVPHHINQLNRHGSRHMSSNTNIKRLVRQVKLLEGTSANKVKLQQWAAATLAIENDRDLTQLSFQGRREMAGIARRLVDNFGPLLRSGRSVRMQTTHLSRAVESAITVGQTLDAFDIATSQAPASQCATGEFPSADHSSLFFWVDCLAASKFRTRMQTAPVTEEGHAKFQQPIKEELQFNRMVESWMARHFRGQYSSWTFDDQVAFMRAAWDTCAHEKGTLNDPTDVCTFFTDSELATFAILEDITNYVETGPTLIGDQVASKEGCALLGDFINATDRAISSGSAAPAANLRFAHGETLMPLFAFLGWFVEPGVSESTPAAWVNPRRLFNTGVLTPMSTGLQWVLYQCPTANAPATANVTATATNSFYRLAMLHNEEVVAAPSWIGCDNRNYCEWNKIKSWLQPMSCSYEQWRDDVCEGLVQC